MASGINIYSQLLISTIRISDITNSRKLLISDISNPGIFEIRYSIFVNYSLS